MNTFEIAKLIGDVPKELLTATETHVLSKLAFFGNYKGEKIWPSIETLSKKTKLCKRTIAYILKNLIEKGFLLVVSKPKNGSHIPVQYNLNLKLLTDIAKVEEVNCSITQPFNHGSYCTGYNESYANNSSSSANFANIQCNSCIQSTHISTNDLPKTNNTREAESESKLNEPPKLNVSIDLLVDRVCAAPVEEQKVSDEVPELKAKIQRKHKYQPANQKTFELFWLAYVLKVGKGAARKAFERAEKKFELQAAKSSQIHLAIGAPTKTFLDVIFAALEAQKTERARRAELGLWTPNWKHPATWLNQECWNDVTKSFEELQKEAEVKRVMKHSEMQRKPNYADKVQAANTATGNIIKKFYPDLAKHFPAFAPETKQTSSAIALRQEVVINAIQ